MNGARGDGRGQLGVGETLLPGVDGDAYFQEGPQVGAWKDRAGCHWSHFRADRCCVGALIVPPHPRAQDPAGLRRIPGPHLPVRKAKPANIPSLFCSVSRLCGVAVSQTISPRAPRPVRRLNCGVRQRWGPGVALPGQHGQRDASPGATRDTPWAPHLEEVGHHVDVGPHGCHEHAESKAGIDPLQVLLGGGRAAGEEGAVRLGGGAGAAPRESPQLEPGLPGALLTYGRT